MEYFELRAMNTDILLAAEGPGRKVSAGFQRVQSLITGYEQRFTRFSEQSELAQLNHAAGTWFYARPDLFEIIWQARAFFSQTGGLFDPSILSDLRRVGYDRSMDEIRTSGVVGAPRAAKERRPDFRKVKFDRSKQAIWLPPGMEIDLGGIAKGWIAEKAASVLSYYSSACVVNAGGDMVLVGLPEGETAWEVGLEDPRDPDRDLAILWIPPGSVATSSVTKRRWKQGDSWRHHLIDPRRGEPAETDWLSVTVIASRATQAEVYAKALLIAGSGQAIRIAASHPEIAFIAVDGDGMLLGSENSQEYLISQEQPQDRNLADP